MEQIKYLMNLPDDKRIQAGMMFIIVFLATGWGVTRYNYDNYRVQCEKEKTRVQKESSDREIKLYNKIIDGQTRRQDLLDSTISQIKPLIENIKNQK